MLERWSADAAPLFSFAWRCVLALPVAAQGMSFVVRRINEEAGVCSLMLGGTSENVTVDFPREALEVRVPARGAELMGGMQILANPVFHPEFRRLACYCGNLGLLLACRISWGPCAKKHGFPLRISPTLRKKSRRYAAGARAGQARRARAHVRPTTRNARTAQHRRWGQAGGQLAMNTVNLALVVGPVFRPETSSI